MTPLPQAPNSSSPLSPSALKSEKRASSPVAQVKVSPLLQMLQKWFYVICQSRLNDSTGFSEPKIVIANIAIKEIAFGRDMKMRLYSVNNQLQITLLYHGYIWEKNSVFMVHKVTEKHDETKKRVRSEYIM